MAMKIRAFILIMTGAIVLPIAIFAAVALETLLRSERDAALSTMKEAADATALLVDNELSNAEAALRVLAQSPHLASGDMENFYRHARTADRGEGGRTILFLPSGQQLINTVVPLGAKLLPPPDYVRTRTRDVIDSGRTVVSGLIKGAVQQIPFFQTYAKLTVVNFPVEFLLHRRRFHLTVYVPGQSPLLHRQERWNSPPTASPTTRSAADGCKRTKPRDSSQNCLVRKVFVRALRGIDDRATSS